MRQFVVLLIACIFLVPTVTTVLAQEIRSPSPLEMVPYSVTVPPPQVQRAIGKIAGQVSEEYLFAYESKLQGFGSRFYNANGNVNCVKWLNESGTGMGRIKVSYHNWTTWSTMLGKLVTATDVVYTIPGLNTSSDRVYYMYGHMDDIQFDDYGQVRTKAPGADDDASGTASMLETARILSRYDFQDTIKFAFFNGEEIGLYGSTYYSQNISNVWHENVQGGIDYDMIGYSDGTQPYDLDLWYNTASTWEYNYLVDVNQRYGIGLRPHGVLNDGSIPSDINEFYAIGKPSVMGIEYQFSPFYHQFTDTVDKLNMTLEKKATKLAVAALSEMSRLIYVDVAIDQKNLTLSDPKPTEGKNVTVTANITNTGNINATNLEVTFYDNGFPFADNHLWVPSGGKNTTSATWKPTIGNHNISVVLDPKNEIVETDETNNSAFVHVGVNDRPVAILSVTPPSLLTNETVTFNGSLSSDMVGGIHGYNFSFGDGTSTGWVMTPSVTHSYPQDGTYNTALTVKDKEGAESLKATMPVKVLDRAPLADPSSNVSRALTLVPIKFLSLAKDPDGTIKVLWDLGDGNTSTENDPVHSYAKAGAYTIKLLVTDDDKNTANYELRLIIDDRAPTVTITSESLTGDIRSDFMLGAEATDPDGTILAYEWDLGDGSTGSAAVVSHTYAKPGNYTVRLTVRDDDGSEARTLANITIIDKPPEAFASAVSSGAVTMKKIAFRGDESTDMEGPITYLWDFGDGNSSTEADPQHAYFRTGTYKVTLTVKDTSGQSDKVELEPIKVFNRLPKADFRTFGNFTLNGTVYFDATNSSDPEGSIVYSWEFGDTTEGLGAVPSHIYPKAGTYYVNLTVTDLDGGQAKATKTVIVKEPPPPPPPPKKIKPKDNSGTITMLWVMVIILIVLVFVLILALAMSRRKRPAPQQQVAPVGLGSPAYETAPPKQEPPMVQEATPPGPLP
jgi:PKD repeat protein